MQGMKLDLWIPFLYSLSGWRLPIVTSSDNRYPEPGTPVRLLGGYDHNYPMVHQILQQSTQNHCVSYICDLDIVNSR